MRLAFPSSAGSTLIAVFICIDLANAQVCPELSRVGSLGGIETFAEAISADGRVIVGHSQTAPFSRWSLFRLEVGGTIENLGGSGSGDIVAIDVSADGEVILGNALTPIPSTSLASGSPVVWTRTTGLQAIPTDPSWQVIPRAISGDGQTVVGWLRDPATGFDPFRWTPATGYERLPEPGSSHGIASGVNHDGTMVVGWAPSTNASGVQETVAIRWDATGAIEEIRDQSGRGGTNALAINESGDVVVGTQYSANSPSSRAFRWTSSGGLEYVDTAGAWDSVAEAVSADGDVIVGWWRASVNDSARAFRWTSRQGFHDLGPLAALGGAIAGASDVSADGSVIIGSFTTGGPIEGFHLQQSVVGSTICRPAVPNSTGCAGALLISGAPLTSGNDMTLAAVGLPAGALTLFLTSREAANIPAFAGGAGTLCLGGAIGRFRGNGQITSAGLDGRTSITVDVNSMPTPLGLVSPQGGETWYYQAWHRDAASGFATNLTDAVAVQF